MTTKRLAKELGLLRQRSKSSRSKKSLVSNQIFSYLIVIDFESTCWREKNNHSQEIIEFPAVLLNTSTGDVESEFHAYVQPQEHPVLSEFCTELTGITQMQVEAGVPLQICLSQFSRWLQNLQLEKGVVFPNTQPRQSEPSPQQKPCTFLTWSDWDLGVCLQYECKRKQLHKPDVLNSWIDLRSTYRLFYSRKPKGLNGALQDLGIQFSGREHSGLDDSRNTAQLAARMMRDGCIMKITKSLDRNPLVGKPKFGKSSSIFNKENRTNKKEEAPTTIIPSSSETPRRASQMQPCSENDTKDLDTEKNSGSAQPSLPACRSLISPKTLLNGSTGPLWGRSRRSAASDRGSSNSYSVTINSASTGAHSNNNKSLVLCSTTVSCFSNPRQRNQVAETGLTSGLMEEQGALLVETEERCGSYDDVVLDEGDSRNGPDLQCDTEFMSEFDSGCYECVETNDFHSQVHKYKSKEDLIEARSAGKNSKMQNITRDSSTKTKAYTKISNHVNEVMQHAGTSATHFTVARRKTERRTSMPLKETSVRPHMSFKTSVPSLITPKPFVPEKTSTPNTSFVRPGPVLAHLKHHKTLKSSFAVFTEPTKEAAAAPGSSSRSSLHTPNNILSSLSTNTRSSFSSRSSFGATAKGVQRVTSPLCECGRRAKRQLVSNGGPNHGRGFYCCPVRRSGGGRVERGCQFFKWESAVMQSSSVRAPPIRSSVSLCQINSTLSLQQAHRPTRKSC